MLSYLRQTASADYLCPDCTVSKHFYTMVYHAHQKNKKINVKSNLTVLPNVRTGFIFFLLTSHHKHLTHLTSSGHNVSWISEGKCSYSGVEEGTLPISHQSLRFLHGNLRPPQWGSRKLRTLPPPQQFSNPHHHPHISAGDTAKNLHKGKSLLLSHGGWEAASYRLPATPLASQRTENMPGRLPAASLIGSTVLRKQPDLTRLMLL